MGAPATFDTLALFDALRAAGLDDSQARAIVAAKRAALESCRSGKLPDKLQMASEFRSAGFDEAKMRALIGGFHSFAERLLRWRGIAAS